MKWGQKHQNFFYEVLVPLALILWSRSLSMGVHGLMKLIGDYAPSAIYLASFSSPYSGCGQTGFWWVMRAHWTIFCNWIFCVCVCVCLLDLIPMWKASIGVACWCSIVGHPIVRPGNELELFELVRPVTACLHAGKWQKLNGQILLFPPHNGCCRASCFNRMKSAYFNSVVAVLWSI